MTEIEYLSNRQQISERCLRRILDTLVGSTLGETKKEVLNISDEWFNRLKDNDNDYRRQKS